MEELTKRNGKGVWLREIEKALKRFDASLEWLSERIALRDEEIEGVNGDAQLERRVKSEKLKAIRMKSIAEMLEEVEALVDTHFHRSVDGLFQITAVCTQFLLDMVQQLTVA